MVQKRVRPHSFACGYPVLSHSGLPPPVWTLISQKQLHNLKEHAWIPHLGQLNQTIVLTRSTFFLLAQHDFRPLFSALPFPPTPTLPRVSPNHLHQPTFVQSPQLVRCLALGRGGFDRQVLDSLYYCSLFRMSQLRGDGGEMCSPLQSQRPEGNVRVNKACLYFILLIFTQLPRDQRSHLRPFEAEANTADDRQGQLAIFFFPLQTGQQVQIKYTEEELHETKTETVKCKSIFTVVCITAGQIPEDQPQWHI